MQVRRKGYLELSWTVIEVIIIVIGLVLIMTLIRTWWQPYKVTSFASAEMLRMAIDDVCAGADERTVNFDFSQPQPITFIGLPLLRQIMPSLMIKSASDPSYVLYYQAYPPGEAIYWEAYMDLPKRVFIMIAPTPEHQQKHAKEYLEGIVAQVHAQPGLEDAAVIFPNIVIGNNTAIIGDVGNWGDDNVYKFGILSSNQLNTSSIKYRTCSEEPALCLKTKESIYPLTLPSCKGKIQDIVFDFNTLKNAASLSAFSSIIGSINPIIAVALGALKLEALKSNNRVDFNIASPCKMKLTISKGTRSCWDFTHADSTIPLTGIPLDLVEAGKKYNIYKLEGDELTTDPTKTRVSCMHRIGDVPDEYNKDYADVPVILIQVKEYGNNWCTQSNVITRLENIHPVTSSTQFTDKIHGLPAIISRETKFIFNQFKSAAGDTTWMWP